MVESSPAAPSRYAEAPRRAQARRAWAVLVRLTNGAAHDAGHQRASVARSLRDLLGMAAWLSPSEFPPQWLPGVIRATQTRDCVAAGTWQTTPLALRSTRHLELIKGLAALGDPARSAYLDACETSAAVAAILRTVDTADPDSLEPLLTAMRAIATGYAVYLPHCALPPELRTDRRVAHYPLREILALLTLAHRRGGHERLVATGGIDPVPYDTVTAVDAATALVTSADSSLEPLVARWGPRPYPTLSLSSKP